MALIVSAYYKIPSKQQHSWYMNHMKTYFDLLSGQKKVFFCEENIKVELERTCNTANTTFIIRPFTELHILKKFPFEVWKNQLQYDPEKYHTPELGIIWANKKEFVQEALSQNPDVEWGCWVDAGCIRTYDWRPHIQSFLAREDFKRAGPGVYLQCIRPFEKKSFYLFPDAYIAGALILFHTKYIGEYSTLYDQILKWYIHNKKSITMDQYIMASIVSNYGPHWIKVVNHTEIPKPCPNEWFFFFSKW